MRSVYLHTVIRCHGAGLTTVVRVRAAPSFTNVYPSVSPFQHLSISLLIKSEDQNKQAWKKNKKIVVLFSLKNMLKEITLSYCYLPQHILLSFELENYAMFSWIGTSKGNITLRQKPLTRKHNQKLFCRNTNCFSHLAFEVEVTVSRMVLSKTRSSIKNVAYHQLSGKIWQPASWLRNGQCLCAVRAYVCVCVCQYLCVCACIFSVLLPIPAFIWHESKLNHVLL